ncbi:MAG: CoA-binding protein [Chloroflexota bacterium]|nr:CoA-binding protein [Chloroflexota bacterium]
MTFDYMFNPRSIAVVGASGGTYNAATNIFLNNLISFGFKGGIYPINLNAGEVSELKAYSTILDVPGPIDHVISGVRAELIPQLLSDCKVKGVKTLHLYTAGFAETGIDDRGDLQGKIAAAVKDSGVRILGPNCMGIYSPAAGVTFCPDFPREPGPVGFISQSGSYSLIGVRNAGARGVRFSKLVSFGNASDIDECDMFEYLGNDPETEIIAAYIEGTRNGDRLRRVLAEAAAKKPVIIIKKGGTEAGKRGASSHTGAMAGDDSVWDALIRQAGAIRVEDLEEMIDLLTTFQFFKLPRGKKAVLIGIGGGPSVRSADDCERARLTLPGIPDEVVEELRKTAPVAGSMLRNPVDVGGYHMDWVPVIRTLAAWPENDMFIWQIAPDIEPFAQEGFLRQYCLDQRARFLDTFLETGKPLAVVVHMVERKEAMEIQHATRELCIDHGVPFYTSVYSAARAIVKFMDYHDRLKESKK